MTKISLLTILLITFLVSCSQVNTESKEYYSSQKESKHFSINNDRFRHGLVPIPYTEARLKKSEKKLNQSSVARGAKLYQQNCFKCHGVNADGNGPESAKLGQRPKSLVAIAKKVPNFKLYMMVSQWKGDMPGWKSMLNEKETVDLKNYILSLVKK
jgi:mono/diheme cytochrome c family protein